MVYDTYNILKLLYMVFYSIDGTYKPTNNLLRGPTLGDMVI